MGVEVFGVIISRFGSRWAHSMSSMDSGLCLHPTTQLSFSSLHSSLRGGIFHLAHSSQPGAFVAGRGGSVLAPTLRSVGGWVCAPGWRASCTYSCCVHGSLGVMTTPPAPHTLGTHGIQAPQIAELVDAAPTGASGCPSGDVLMSPAVMGPMADGPQRGL